MDLSHISSAEPPLTRFILQVVLIATFIAVVTQGYIGSTNQDLPSWVGLVISSVATWENVISEVI